MARVLEQTGKLVYPHLAGYACPGLLLKELETAVAFWVSELLGVTLAA